MARLRVLRASLLALTLTFWSRAWVASRRGVVHGMLALPLPALADVIRLQQAPLPKEYRDSLVPAAQALKEALEAEESVGDAFIGEEAEKTLSGLEQKAGQLIQKYGERYMSERGLRPDDPLRDNQAYFLMEDAVNIFEVAVKTDQLPKARGKLIAKLQEVLDLAEKVGIQES
ncbi:unnamed protein product [Cladocopium goreaui]|uniref:Uncharacterized protein n=1 Tax=Cladocopium goreaui TaxID=2562237 RepID=A0A9P1D165_9DINO|nr:unnamed protein product [Cladocopium goreaui]